MINDIDLQEHELKMKILNNIVTLFNDINKLKEYYKDDKVRLYYLTRCCGKLNCIERIIR